MLSEPRELQRNLLYHQAVLITRKPNKETIIKKYITGLTSADNQ